MLSFAGATSAGFVSAVDEEPRVSPESTLVAVRFAKQRGHWLVDYINQGHSSSLVDQSNYAPAGFLPGSHAQSAKDWAILILGFLAVVAVVVLLDRLLGGSRAHLGGLDETTSESPGRTGRPEASSSVAPVWLFNQNTLE